MLIASSQGGVNIEEVAVENPDAILYEPIDIVEGLKPEQARKIAEKVGLGNVADQISKTLINMYDLFIKKDATLIEINPYAEDAFDTSKCESLDPASARTNTNFDVDDELESIFRFRSRCQIPFR